MRSTMQARCKLAPHVSCDTREFKPQFNDVAFWPSMAKAAVQAEHALLRCRVRVMVLQPAVGDGDGTCGEVRLDLQTVEQALPEQDTCASCGLKCCTLLQRGWWTSARPTPCSSVCRQTSRVRLRGTSMLSYKPMTVWSQRLAAALRSLIRCDPIVTAVFG